MSDDNEDVLSGKIITSFYCTEFIMDCFEQKPTTLSR